MALNAIIVGGWAALGVYWLIAATGAKHGHRSGRVRLPGLTLVVVIIVERVLRPDTLAPNALVVRVIGVVLFAAGLGLAVWARIYLGRNWGMPMTRKDEPELVTSGPYRFVRHPIYSGLLLGILGSALATSVYWLIGLVVVGAYFIYSAKVEEGLMTENFPAQYPGYKAKTKMLIPFVL